jgi:four helix bundle protein
VRTTLLHENYAAARCPRPAVRLALRTRDSSLWLVGQNASGKKERWRRHIIVTAFFGMSDFKKLRVWRKAHALALNIHRVAGSIRGAQLATLRSQMTRAAMSISANIVEGREHKNEREFARFLGYALASSSELENHLLVARDVRAITKTDFDSSLSQVIDVRKMLHGLLAKLSNPNPSPSTNSVPSPSADSEKRAAGSGQQRG